MSLLLTRAKDAYISACGFHTNRKLVVIESDDWGSIRMPSKHTFERLISLGDNPQKDAFLSNDCLESQEDLDALYEVLYSVKDSKGNPAVITANFATANPNFEKIDYNKGVYSFEPFFETYNRYYGDNAILEHIKQPENLRCFKPQLHCREHMNVGHWMKSLKEQHPDTLLAFDNYMIGVGGSFSENNHFGYMDAFNTSHSTDDELREILTDAYGIFESAFGFPSETFVAPCYVWSKELEEALNNLGIRFIQSSAWQNCPISKKGKKRYKRKIHFTGEKNKLGQLYTVRNCTYEPAYYQNPTECSDMCLKEIMQSFSNKKPAVICSHRFNYIGSINPQNRTNNLYGLQILFKKIISEYPEVEFISSPELFAIMESELK